MSDVRRVTLSREQRDFMDVITVALPAPARDYYRLLIDAVAAWDAAEPLPCPACNGTRRQPSYEGCGTTVICSVCDGTGRAA